MYSEQGRDRTGALAFMIALVVVVGILVAVPSLIPPSVRNLVGLGPDRVAPKRSVETHGSYSFLAHQAGDASAPVGYDPCRRIKIRINPAGGPPDAVELIRSAMSEVERATGLRFEYEGMTDKRPRWESEYTPTILGGVRRTPALVSWADAEEVSQLEGNVAGIGGSLGVAEKGGEVRYVTGGITLDADSFAVLAASPGGEQEERAIVLHEFGHLVGLAHVHDEAELMNAENVGLLRYGPGDLEGLAKIGAISCG